MSMSLAELQRHRGELVERARAERETVRVLFEGQRNLFWLADRGIAMVRLIAARRGLLLVAGLAFALVQPRRALRWALKTWSLFRLLRSVSRAFG